MFAILMAAKGGVIPVAETSYIRVPNYILILTPDGDTIRRPIYCAPGVICDSIVQVVDPDPGEWWTRDIIGRIDTIPPQLPPLEGCKGRFGKPTRFVFDLRVAGSTYYVPTSGTITNYLDSAQYYGSKGIKFYVKTDRVFYLFLGVWLHDKEDFYVMESKKYGKGLHLVNVSFYDDLIPGIVRPPNQHDPMDPEELMKRLKPRNRLFVRLDFSPTSSDPFEVEVSELCLY